MFVGALNLVWDAFVYIATAVGFISCLTYLVMQLVQRLLRPQNLKCKYSAEWALVTGASSGIGKSIVERLASQDINVVMVAIDDDMLRDVFVQCVKAYPKVHFRKVGVNLGRDAKFMQQVVEATSDIDVTLVFSNAGGLLSGFFVDTEYEKVQANFECNCVAPLPLIHHFARRMIAAKRRGLISITSSSVSYFPAPTQTLYAPGKSFLTAFGAMLAVELKCVGIDVVVIHPSAVRTAMLNSRTALSSLRFATLDAVAPTVIVDGIFAAAGRVVVWDQGRLCMFFRLLMKTVDYAFLTALLPRAAPWISDFKLVAKESKIR